MSDRDSHPHRPGADKTRARRSSPIVFLHVGEPKTGTTYLQQVMWSNRAELAQQGVTLPGNGLRDHFRANQDLREAPQAADDPAGSWSGEWEALARQTLQAENTAVISHELFAGASAEQAGRAVATLQPAEVHVVLTVRDFVTLLPAEWQETVKHRNDQRWTEWLAGVVDAGASAEGRRREWFWRVHDTLDVLSRWSAHVPPERIHVVTVPPPGSPRDLLWHRFATLIGVDPTVVDTSRVRSNVSLGLAEAELLRRVNAALPAEVPGWFYAGRVKDHLAHQVLAGRQANGRLRLPAEHERWARQQADRLVEGLRESGYDVVGDLENLFPRTSTGPSAHPDDVAAEQVLEAAVDSLTALLVKQYRATQRSQQSDGTVRRAAVRGSTRLRQRLHALAARHTSARVLRDLARVLLHRLPGRGRGG